MNFIFQIVFSLLMWISGITGFSYNEVNIIAYYIILPFVYVFLLDRILKTHAIKILYLAAVLISLLVIKDFSAFSDWLFQESVDILLSLKIFGWDYIISSVLVCVIFPAIVFLAMSHLAYPWVLRAVWNRANRLTSPR